MIDGKVINPDSGAKDDPIPRPYSDYQDIYKAVGLDPSIPWYQTLGNHDRYWMGLKPAGDYLQQTAVGETVLKMGNLLLPGGLDARDYYMGTLDGSTVYGDIVGTGSENDFEFPPKVAADPDRRLLNRQQFMSEFLNSSSLPKGHGFTQENVDEDFACYSFEPKADVPIKVIVLDSNVEEITPGLDPTRHIYGYGTLDEKRYNWLVAELDEGQANDKLMIIAAQAFGASYDVPRNAELIKHLTPAMQEKIKGYGKPL